MTILRRDFCRLALAAPLAACARDHAPRCATCGMKIDPTSPFFAEVADGSMLWNYDTNRCAIEGHRRTHGALRVREFYTQQLVDADTVGFVEDSDVLGPMGPDPIPVSLDKIAKFQKDHGGKERTLAAILQDKR